MTNMKKSSARIIFINTLNDLLQKKAFQKISVNELCENANLSRSSFYANFQDKYHLLSCCFENISKELDEQIAARPPKDFIIVTLDSIQKKSSFFYHAMGSEMDEEVIHIVHHFFNKHMLSFLNHQIADGRTLPGPVEMVSSFYVGGILSSILTWIQSGYKISKEELASCQLNLLKDIL